MEPELIGSFTKVTRDSRSLISKHWETKACEPRLHPCGQSYVCAAYMYYICMCGPAAQTPQDFNHDTHENEVEILYYDQGL
jgi:hypothetical protein